MVTNPNWMAPFHIARATAQPRQYAGSPGGMTRAAASGTVTIAHSGKVARERERPGCRGCLAFAVLGPVGPGDCLLDDDERVQACQLARAARDDPQLDRVRPAREPAAREDDATAADTGRVQA